MGFCISSAAHADASSFREAVLAPIRQQIRAHSGGASRTHPRFFFTAFGAQDAEGSAEHAHAFATVTRANGGAGADQTEALTISWLPATFSQDLRVCVGIAPFCPPVEGHNYSLDESLEMAHRSRLIVGAWGPYEVTNEFLTAFTAQYLWLESSEVDYIANDFIYRVLGKATNCLHAVFDLDGEHPDYWGPLTGAWGVPGMQSALSSFNDHGAEWFKQPIDPGHYAIHHADQGD